MKTIFNRGCKPLPRTTIDGFDLGIKGFMDYEIMEFWASIPKFPNPYIPQFPCAETRNLFYWLLVKKRLHPLPDNHSVHFLFRRGFLKIGGRR